jgi:hypothetical protein
MKILNINVNVDNHIYSVDVNTLNDLKRDKRVFAKIDRQCKREAPALYSEIQKTANISTVLKEISTDTKNGKATKNYTIVLFNDKVILCKNPIHDLILRIFGGRRDKVGEVISNYLDSSLSEPSKIELKLQESGVQVHKNIKERIAVGISDYNVIKNYPEVSDGVKGQFLSDIQDLISVYKKSNQKSSEIENLIEVFENDEARQFDVMVFKPEVNHEDRVIDMINGYKSASEQEQHEYYTEIMKFMGTLPGENEDEFSNELTQAIKKFTGILENKNPEK